MQEIINGKRYDTETATEIGEDSYSGSIRDFSYWTESLYRTPKGAWFTIGSGGPSSSYARAVDANSCTGDTNVFRVLSDSEALAWCENHGVGVDTIEKYFEVEDA